MKDGVTGVRLVQRQKNFQFTNFRFELWMTTGEETSTIAKDIKKYLEDKIVDECLDCAGLLSINWDSHKSKE